ncbi:MAG: Outer membrane lipoprotein LpoA, binds and activates PBP1a [Pelagibacterales bacterium]|nr:Outer membrane lipoprotein LpoA, binds and activates PBP1a [Pelagibacterales bacterium]
MKKLLTFLILTYLSFTLNSSEANQELSNLGNKETLRIGVLLPLSGEFEDIGKSFLKAIQLALYDISNNNIKIYPKDNKGSALKTYLAAKEFEDEGIKIVIGPVFHESLERLNEINNITFISLTNKTNNIPKNAIAFGVNVESQIYALKKYFDEINVSKTLLLSPKSEFLYQSKSISNKKNLDFYKIYLYDTNPKKITGEIENITKYKERKNDLKRRIKILENSDLYKDKQELKELEQLHTLGKINFDSVVIVDFGERLKSVLTSFVFSDVSSKKVNFFTINQWFDETLFTENAMQNLHFPSINFNNLKKFNKKFTKKFKEKPNSVSILAYDALGLIYYCWINNNLQFNENQLYNKKGFKGLHAEFKIEDNISKQKLKIYKVKKNKFLKVF